MKKSVKLLWRFFFWGLLLVVFIFSLAYFGVFGKMPSLKELENPEADLASEIISADGLLMGKYYSENRSEVKYNEISPNIIHALIATEDQNFYDHSGIDAKAVARAVFKLGTDGGGSPITQQLAKMILRQGSGNVVERVIDKMKEWIVAVRLERNFTKEEILTLYLNRAPWGNLYGIRNASRTYFQKEPSALKLEEAAVLVGMLKGFIYNPISRPDAALNRRNTVIQRMVDAKQHYLTQADADKLKAKPLITNYKPIDEAIGIAPYYRRALIDVIKKWCKEHTNPKTGEPYDLYRDGLKFYTTIDTRMQKYAEEAVLQHMPVLQKKLNAFLKGRVNKLWDKHHEVLENGIKYSERRKNMLEAGLSEEEIRKSFDVPVKMKIFTWDNPKHEKDTVMTPLDSIKYHKQLMQVSFVAMDPKTGEIKAYVGGFDYKWFKYDNASAMRQVGSTFKPLLYTLAVTDAGYTPETVIPGGALTLNGKTISGGGGTMAYCLAQSKNAAAWRLMSVIGVKRTLEFAQQCGIKTKLPPYPSIALGSAEIPMIEMLQSYTMFPNRGYNTEPVYLTRIEDKNGNLVFEFPLAQSKQIIGEVDDYTMVKLMEGVIKSGTARALNSYNIPVAKAGKTGTTNNNTDGWFIGYTPDLLAGTWVGCSDPFIPIYSNNAGGSEMSAPRWGIFMSKVAADKKLDYNKKKDFDEPPEMKMDPIYADNSRFAELLNQGDSLTLDSGVNDGGDFFNDEGIEENTGASEINKSPSDTSKKQPPGKEPIKESDSKKPDKTAPKKPEEKSNDY
ncbi:MAG TPA: transglycosylase domain-containing protein [Ferruginibacter sp.]|nr:transglycosylase domain-containing protein [Ferruginibacter sp.]